MTSDREQVAAIAAEHLPADIAGRWLRLLRPAAGLRLACPGDPVAAVLGGEPLMPDGAQWPAWEAHGPLSFIASVDCAALATVPLDITLPRAGSLQFFYFDGQYDNFESAVGSWDPESLAQGARVLYVPPGAATSPRPSPAGIKPYHQVLLTAVPVVSYPEFEHPDLDAAFAETGTGPDDFADHPVNGDEFLRALSLRHREPVHQVGGYAAPAQGPVEREVAVAALDGLDGDEDDPRLLAEQARWTLLAQFDSDHRAGMAWGDVGKLYWLARRAEMTAAGPGHTSFTWQCS